MKMKQAMPGIRYMYLFVNSLGYCAILFIIFSYALNIIDEYMETLVKEQEFLSSEERWEKVLRCIPKKYLFYCQDKYYPFHKDIQAHCSLNGRRIMERHGKGGKEWSQRLAKM